MAADIFLRSFDSYLHGIWDRLCNVRFTCVQADIDLKEVTTNSATGDYNPASLADVISTQTLNSLVVQTWHDKSGAPVSLLL